MSAIALPRLAGGFAERRGLLVPADADTLLVSDFALSVGEFDAVPAEWRELLGLEDATPRLRGFRGALRRLELVAAAITGFSQASQAKALDHVDGKASWSSPANTFLALATSAVQETDTGATIVEPTYTGYGRKTIAAADWASATAAAPSVAATNTAETFNACTGSSSVVIGWALCDSTTTGAGAVIVGGTCTSVTISTTQTPPTIASGALSVSLT